jgi:hypothetical protein
MEKGTHRISGTRSPRVHGKTVPLYVPIQVPTHVPFRAVPGLVPGPMYSFTFCFLSLVTSCTRLQHTRDAYRRAYRRVPEQEDAPAVRTKNGSARRKKRGKKERSLTAGVGRVTYRSGGQPHRSLRSLAAPRLAADLLTAPPPRTNTLPAPRREMETKSNRGKKLARGASRRNGHSPHRGEARKRAREREALRARNTREPGDARKKHDAASPQPRERVSPHERLRAGATAESLAGLLRRLFLLTP